MSSTEKREAMRDIRDEVVNLTESELYTYRVENDHHPVIGEGDHDADIVFIGEAPGRNEALHGRPFCGAAGKTLDTLLESIALSRDDIYITNIVKDRPPKNRDPFPEEIALYGPLLDRQLAIIEPRAIVTLGRYAMNYIMEKYGLVSMLEPISVAHGKTYTAQVSYGEIAIIPQYHPAAAIYNRQLIDTLVEDFKEIQKFA